MKRFIYKAKVFWVGWHKDLGGIVYDRSKQEEEVDAGAQLFEAGRLDRGSDPARAGDQQPGSEMDGNLKAINRDASAYMEA